MWEARSRWLLAASLAASAFVVAQMAMFVLKVVFCVRMPFVLFDYCVAGFRYLGFPISLPLMSAVIVSTLAVCLRFAIREAGFSRRFGRMLRYAADRRGTRRYARRFGFGERELTVIRDEAPVAMTIGFVRPRIVLSTGLLRLLDPSEIAAVIAHERHHMLRRDPLALFALSLMRRALWYVPLIGWTEDKYRMAIEVMADRHAIAASGSAKALGSALLKLLRQGGAAAGPAASASFADASVNVRIRLLLDPHYRPSLRPPVRSTLLSLAMLGLLLLAAHG
ncbi:M56 family metallopeptidase [Cohnella sp. JJ-181]|uniref:M56 family metallopeptidase n=1 Tax=Cohnella rhizoplanae TaxID=2974897 RepID=UPI0022FF89F6|nr:M56 family metallopeptidase [Cohnella sp. JJ-181]CAI6066058.1 Protease HtpX [Cohnella sp. JJ-181]